MRRLAIVTLGPAMIGLRACNSRSVLGGGLGNLSCVSACFGGNVKLALGAVAGITCATQGCEKACGLGP